MKKSIQTNIKNYLIDYAVGKENAAAKETIMSRFGLSDKSFKSAIEKLRKKGWPVKSQRGMYFIDTDEIKKQNEILKSKGKPVICLNTFEYLCNDTFNMEPDYK